MHCMALIDGGTEVFLGLIVFSFFLLFLGTVCVFCFMRFYLYCCCYLYVFAVTVYFVFAVFVCLFCCNCVVCVFVLL